MIWLIIGIILFVIFLMVILGYKEVVGNLADRVNELEEEVEENRDGYGDNNEDTHSVMEKHQYRISSESEKKKHVGNQGTENKQISEKEWEVPEFLKKDK